MKQDVGAAGEEFYQGHGFDRLAGPEAANVYEFEHSVSTLRKGASLRGNLYQERVRADFPGTDCLLPINFLVMPERQFDYVLLRQKPGQRFPLHTHGYGEEVYLVISGRGIVIIGDERLKAGPHDIFHIPAGVPHGFEVPAEETETFDLFVVNAPAVPRRNRSRYWAAKPLPESDGLPK